MKCVFTPIQNCSCKTTSCCIAQCNFGPCTIFCGNNFDYFGTVLQKAEANLWGMMKLTYKIQARTSKDRETTKKPKQKTRLDPPPDKKQGILKLK